MAEHIPGGPPGTDPLGDRLRATFNAERVDIERRHLAHDVSSTRSRPLMWIPFAAAAALVAVAGFLFIGNRSNDTAVDLDIAGQTDGTGVDNSTNVPGGPTPIGVPGQNALPAPFPAGSMPDLIPFITGESFCNDFDPAKVVVWRSDAGNSPALVEPGAGVNTTRQILSGTRVDLTGGCTAGATSVGPGQWYEIASVSGARTEWIRSEYLISEDEYQQWIADGTNPPTPTPQPDFGTPVAVPQPAPVVTPFVNECAQPLIPVVFVWDIPWNDPDGGLVAHTAPAVDAPVTRILKLDDVISPTGVCRLSPSGSPWFELLNSANGSRDWASARYLNGTAQQACLRGEQFGSRARDVEQLTHYLVAGDTLGSIAQRYGIAIEELLASNPALDSGQLLIGEPIWVPGVAAVPDIVFGPLDGLAIVDGDRVAFTAPFAPGQATTYRWYERDAVELNECFGSGLTGPACLVGDIALVDFQSPEPIWTGQGPQTVEHTGRTITTGIGYVEVQLQTENGVFIGFVNPQVTQILDGECVPTGQTDSFAAAPCNATDSEVITGSTVRGSLESDADHVLNLRAEEGSSANGPCTRIVIDFGVAGIGGGNDRLASLLPEIGIVKTPETTRIVLPAWTNSAGIGKPTRLDALGSTVLVTGSGVSQPAIEILYHYPTQVNVWFLENPARVIVDYLNSPPSFDYAGPFGEDFVLRRPIQTDLRGPGILEGQQITVNGFGRPFEAQGVYRVYEVSTNVDLENFQRGDPDPLFEGPLRTSSWIDGWGQFEVQLPALGPGTYLAVFGEIPPTDEIEFIGAGQLFRIYDPATPRLSSYPVAELLPSVRIPG